MKEKKSFYKIILEMDGKPISKYGELIENCDFGRFVLRCGDKAFDKEKAVAHFSVRVPQSLANFPLDLIESPLRRTALEDLILRSFSNELDLISGYDNSGVARKQITIADPAQKILPRSALEINEDYVEARIVIKLPFKTLSYGSGDARVIDGEAACDVFFNDLVNAVEQSMIYCNLDPERIDSALELMEDASHLRKELSTRGLTAFVRQGSLLSRMSDCDLPDYEDLNPLMVEESAEIDFEVPNGGSVRGLGIPTGLTVIIGEANAGRTDLMKALGDGIYNHVAGDGREMAISMTDTAAINSDTGRSVQRVDISPFFAGEDSSLKSYSSNSADRFCSQAASFIEMIEAGARVLLLDESTSDPEFLSGDQRVSALLNSKKRVSLVEIARQLVDELDISIIVAGGANVAEYLPLADNVFKIEAGKVANITEAVKSQDLPAPEQQHLADISRLLDVQRYIMPSSINATCGEKNVVVEAIDRDIFQFGRNSVDVSSASQIAGIYQTNTIGQVIYYARLRYIDGETPLQQVLDMIDRDLTKDGLAGLTPEVRGDLARPRRYEIAAALNRLRAMRIARDK